MHPVTIVYEFGLSLVSEGKIVIKVIHLKHFGTFFFVDIQAIKLKSGAKVNNFFIRKTISLQNNHLYKRKFTFALKLFTRLISFVRDHLG